MASEPAPAPDAKDRLIGEVLANRYQIEHRLGEGAMGAVYKARHVKVGRAFAVKVLHAKLLVDHKVAQRFAREAELAGRLRHANVIGVVDVGETSDGLHYMVMDFAEGYDLAELLTEAPMPGPRIINLSRQLLEGLYHAHEQGLIHRDFKPENVIVEKDDHGMEVPRIVDFGIAILREGGDSPSAEGRLTTNGLVLGTPHYMAPEQAVADPIDHRIDLFALGIVIYEMLCGKLPFDGTGAEIARANLLLDPPRIAQRVPYLEVDPLLEAFSRRLMAKKREHRPATAKAARELLDLIERDRPAAAAALGVPLASARASSVTQDNPPQPHVFEDSSSAQFDTAVAPPPDAKAAPMPLSAQHEISTDLTDPLSYDQQRTRSHRKLAMIGLGLVAAGGLAALVLVRSTGKDTAVKQPVAIAAPAPDKIAPDKITPDKITPDRIAPDSAGSNAPDTAAPDHVAAAVPDTITPGKVTPGTVTPGKITKARTPKGTKPAATVPAVATTTHPAVTEPPVTSKPVVSEAVARPSQTGPTTASLAKQYQDVGRDLKALGPDADDLKIRFRNINISRAMTDPTKVKETSDTLSKLARDIAARSKT